MLRIKCDCHVRSGSGVSNLPGVGSWCCTVVAGSAWSFIIRPPALRVSPSGKTKRAETVPRVTSRCQMDFGILHVVPTGRACTMGSVGRLVGFFLPGIGSSWSWSCRVVVAGVGVVSTAGRAVITAAVGRTTSSRTTSSVAPAKLPMPCQFGYHVNVLHTP